MLSPDVTCAICGEGYPGNYHCDHCHEGICHPCGELSFRATLGYYDHPAPADPPAPLVLSPQDVAALTRYAAHVRRTVGTAGLVRLVTEDEA